MQDNKERDIEVFIPIYNPVTGEVKSCISEMDIKVPTEQKGFIGVFTVNGVRKANKEEQNRWHKRPKK